MKRFILTAMTTGLAFSSMGTASFYINNGTVTTPPMIDATNFVNNGSFSFFSLLTINPIPFDFSNTRNFTNRGVMDATPGFRFDTAPTSTGYRYMAANFYNAGFGATPQNASVTAGALFNFGLGGYSQIHISATNILSRGTLGVSSLGLLDIQGKNVDLARGILTARDTFGQSQLFTDQYWGIGTNRLVPAANFLSTLPNTPLHRVIRGFYFTNLTSFSLPDFALGGIPSLVTTQVVSEVTSNRTVQIVMVRNNAFSPNTNLHVNINIVGATPTSLGQSVVEWSAISVDAAGKPVTNFLYLSDVFGQNPTNAFITNAPFSPVGSFLFVPPFTYQPINYSLGLSSFQQTFPPPLPGSGIPTPYTDPPAAFWGRPVATNLYSAWQVTISPALFDIVDPDQSRIAPGRIEITADKTLDLNLTRVDSANYLKISSTNHFKGASNAIISAAYSDVALGSTNGQMLIANVLAPTVPVISGTITLYSATWTNDVVFAGSTNPVPFNVLLVDSQLSTEVLAQQLDVSVRSTNLVVADSFNVLNNLNLDTDRLTITPTGSFDLLSPAMNWADNAPHLKSLTNFGLITVANELFFHSWNTSGADIPYLDFVNRGSISAAGVVVKANNLIHSGLIQALYGQIFLRGTNVVLEDGGFLAGFEADVVIEARNLSVSNHNIFPGRSISLSVTNSLKSGPNFWQVFAGFNLWKKPVTGDLLETEIYDVGFPYAEVLHTWAGADLGPTAAGFTNNAALGALDLDGGEFTLFTFEGAGPSSNALYVDVLYLLNSATNRDVDGNLIALNLTPGMKLYFSQAFIDDGFGGLTDITTELAGKNGGAIVQVAHTGPVSLPKAPMTSINPALKVKVELTPTRRSLLTWDTTAHATNYLYCISHPSDTNWQVVTNFVSGPTGGPVTVADPLLHNSRFYKVRVDVPAQ